MPEKGKNWIYFMNSTADHHKCLDPIFKCKLLVERREKFKLTDTHLSDTVCENLSRIILVGCENALSEIS